MNHLPVHHNATPPTEGSFDSLGLAPALLEAVRKLHITSPTPIQHRAIPLALDGKDVMGIAQTGTGKTLAFGLPMLQRLARLGGRGLVLLPTRELALQVEETLQKIGRSSGLRTAVLIGGAAMHPQNEALRRKPHIIVATPGRLIDHLEHKTASVSDVSVLVLDEADRMLDMGFAPQINRILQMVPHTRQTMLFSATMPAEIVRIATKYMKTPVRVEIVRAGTTPDKIVQEIFVVRKEQKTRLLDKLLQEFHGSVLVFTRTKYTATKVSRAVRAMGQASAEIHSNRSLSQRRDALEGFRQGRYRVLVATDIAARGIDVTGIEVVINYDVPENAEDYVHRIGRTGRAGMPGRAISFAMPNQGEEVRAIEKFTNTFLPVSKMPELPPERPQPAEQHTQPDRRYAPRRPNFGRGRR